MVVNQSRNAVAPGPLTMCLVKAVDEAKAIYRELAQVRPPVTRAKEQIAYVSAERVRNAQRYVGEMDPMPPWPSDVGNCVVCHAWTSDVPLTTLHSLEPIVLGDIPTKATPKPVEIASEVSASVRDVVDRRCKSCHRRGGQAGAWADFSTDEGVVARARAVVRRVTSEEMPPTGALPVAEQEILRQWLRSAQE